jgi:putative flippase GtrA
MKCVAHLVGLYALFALIAITVNITSQVLLIWLYNGAYALPLSVLLGTAAGLPVKYVLEKRHIFGFEADNLSYDGHIFLIYCATGVLATLLFWLIEWVFHNTFGTDAMRYFGGTIGLTLGYVVKYYLDKRFVFVKRNPAVVS